MSWKLQAMVSERVCGSPTRKLVMLNMAARANDDGSGVYASLPTIAAWSEMDARSVRRIVRELEEDAVIENIGQRKVKHGWVNDWRLNVAALEQLPMIVDELRAKREAVQEAALTTDTVSGVVVSGPEPATTFSANPGHSVPPNPGHYVRPDTVSPGQNVLPPEPTPDTVSANSKNITPPVSEASLPQHPPRSSEDRGTRLPADFRPSSGVILRCRENLHLEGWQIEAILIEFASFWAGVAGAKARKRDWDQTFLNRAREYAGDRRRLAKLEGMRGEIAVMPVADAGAEEVNAERWRKRVDNWRRDPLAWLEEWGPKPNEPGYRGPLLAQDLFAGASR